MGTEKETGHKPTERDRDDKDKNLTGKTREFKI